MLVRDTTLLKGAPVVMKCRMQSSTYLSRNFGSYGHSPGHDIHENRSSVDWLTGENADDLEMGNKDAIEIEATTGVVEEKLLMWKLVLKRVERRWYHDACGQS